MGLINCPASAEDVFGVGEITGTKFINVVVTGVNTKNFFRPMINIPAATKAKLVDLVFSDISSKCGFLLVDNCQSLEIDLLVFENCDISGDVAKDRPAYPMISLGQNCKITSLTNWQFLDCHVTKSLTLVIADVLPAISTIQKCVFENCSSFTYLLQVPLSEQITLENCHFVDINTPQAPLQFNISHTVTITNSAFSKIVSPGQNLIETQAALRELNLNTVEVNLSFFGGFAEITEALSVVSGRFIVSEIPDTLFTLSGAKATFTECRFESFIAQGILAETSGSEFSMNLCDFISCEANVSNIIKISECAKATFSGITFVGCSAAAGSLVYLDKVTSITVENGCFQGTKGRDGVAAYITATTGDATFQLPLCFDLSEELSLNFNGNKPWDKLSEDESIFECKECEPMRTSEPDVPQEKPDGLAPGVIAAIVIVILVVVVAAILIGFFLIRRKMKRDRKTSDEGVDDNDGVDDTVETTMGSGILDDSLRVTEENPIAMPLSENNDAFNALFEERVD